MRCLQATLRRSGRQRGRHLRGRAPQRGRHSKKRLVVGISARKGVGRCPFNRSKPQLASQPAQQKAQQICHLPSLHFRYLGTLTSAAYTS